MVTDDLTMPDDAKIEMFNSVTRETVVISGKEYNQLPYYVRLMWSKHKEKTGLPYATKGGVLGGVRK